MPRIRFSDAAPTRLLGSLGGVVRPALWLLIAAVMIDGLLVHGLWSPVIVSSGSMAPALVGPHFDLTCDQCRQLFAIDADDPPANGMALCPNCEFRQSIAGRPRENGDRVLVDRTAFALREPRRWETIVFRAPDDAKIVAVKRIVGLPGETIELRDGDVYVDGELVRKSLEEFRSLAVQVYDSRHSFTDQAGKLLGWQRNSKYWTVNDAHWIFSPATASSEAISSEGESDSALLFRGHSRNSERSSAFTRSEDSAGSETNTATHSAITDDLAYNQAVHQPLNPVVDWLLDCQIKTDGAGVLRILIDSGRGRSFWLELCPGELRWQLFDEDRSHALAEGVLPKRVPDEPWQLTVASVDAQVFGQWNGQPGFHYDFQPLPTMKPVESPFSFWPDKLQVDLSQIHVFRDLYYSNSATMANLKPGQSLLLGFDEYFVLGDNSPISDDSRTWLSGPAVPRKLILGKPWRINW